MADLFISYAREDAARADAIAQALVAEGFSIFWDKQIPAGQTWADFTETKLLNAAAILVLWSEASTKSQWVREEARIGRDAGKLIPVQIDAAMPPFGFGEVQAASLRDWHGDRTAPDWQRFVAAIRFALERAGKPQPSPQAPAPQAAPPPPVAPVHYGAPPTPPPQQPFAPPPPQAPYGQPAYAASAPTQTPGQARWPTKNHLIAGGVLVGLLGLGAVTYMNDEASGPATPPTSMAVPSSAVTASSGAIATSAALSPAVQAAVTSAQQAEQAAIDQMNAAASLTQQGQAAASAAQANQSGYSVTTLPNGAVAAGEINAILAGRAGMVSIANPQGMLFAGSYQESPQGSSMQGGATWGAASASGYWTYQGANFQFTGVAMVTGRIQWAGSETGAMSSASGQGALTYPDGSRYLGGYRTAGEGPQVQVFRHGLGALYNARGDLVEAGEFASDRLVQAQ